MRAAWALALCAARLFVPSTASAASPSPLQVTIADLPCDDSGRIAADVQRLLEQRGALPRDPASHELSLRLIAPGELLVRLSGPQATHQRVLRFAASDCGALAHTAAFFAQGWLDQSWRNLASQVSSSGPENASRVAAPRPPPAPLADTPPAPRANTFPAPAPSWSVSLQGGMFHALSRPQASPVLGAGAEWQPGSRWGLALFAGWDGPVHAQAGSGAVSLAAWHLAGLLSWNAMADDALRLDLLAGPSFHVLTLEGRGYLENRPTVRGAPSFTTMLRLRHDLTRRMAAFIALTGSFRARREALSVRNLGKVLTIPAERAALVAGIRAGL